MVHKEENPSSCNDLSAIKEAARSNSEESSYWQEKKPESVIAIDKIMLGRSDAAANEI